MVLSKKRRGHQRGRQNQRKKRRVKFANMHVDHIRFGIRLINVNKRDNRIENLQLLKKADHNRKTIAQPNRKNSGVAQANPYIVLESTRENMV